jgi:hypothetical protein
MAHSSISIAYLYIHYLSVLAFNKTADISAVQFFTYVL